MAQPTQQELEQVRALFVGKWVLIYGGKEIKVERVELVNSPHPCFQFFAKGNDLGFVATLSQITPIRAKGARR